MIRTSSQPIRININCVKIPEGTFDTSFRNQEKSVYNIIEKYKNENNIARVQGQSLPVLIGIDNQTQYDINEITIEIIVNVRRMLLRISNSIYWLKVRGLN